jgi:hypothetical protein
MNSTGESDMRNYYDRVKAKQESDMLPQLHRLMSVLVRHALGEWPTDFRIECNPLYQMSAVEKMNVQKVRAERDQINVQNGFVTEGVVTAQLKEDGVYSMLEDDDVDAARELSEPMGPGATPTGEAAKAGAVKAAALTPTAMAGIITVNEARRMQGLTDWPDADGGLTILEFQAKHGGTVAAAVNAEAGQTGEADKADDVPSEKTPPVEDPTSAESPEEVGASDWNPDQPRDENGRWGEGGGSVGTTSGGKSIVAPERIEFIRIANNQNEKHQPIAAVEHVEKTSLGYSRKDHFEAHHALLAAAKEALGRGDADRAYHLGAVASVHKEMGRNYGKSVPMGKGTA